MSSALEDRSIHHRERRNGGKDFQEYSLRELGELGGKNDFSPEN
jgi:hypothetical protein